MKTGDNIYPAYLCVYFFFLAILLLGGLNWGIQSIAGRDLLCILINAADVAGGSATQNTVFAKPTNPAAEWVPRVVYGLVGASFIVVFVMTVLGFEKGVVKVT